MPKLIMSSYCGMSYEIYEGTVEDCRNKAKKICDRHRKKRGGAVTELTDRTWELESPEDARMVSDDDGILSIRGEDKVEEEEAEQ